MKLVTNIAECCIDISSDYLVIRDCGIELTLKASLKNPILFQRFHHESFLNLIKNDEKVIFK